MGEELLAGVTKSTDEMSDSGDDGWTGDANEECIATGEMGLEAKEEDGTAVVTTLFGRGEGRG